MVTFTGTTGNDTFAGTTDNDIIYGGTGNDSLSGANGDDTFFLLASYGNDTINGGAAGEVAGIGDRIDASALITNATLTIGATAENGTLVNGTSNANFNDIESFVLGSGNDSINASAVTNALLGVNVSTGAGADTVTGGAGNDTIDGGAGNDSIDGGAGADSILGGLGDDKIWYGAGNDTVYGGDGNDEIDDINAGNTFVGDHLLYGGAGNDVVFDGINNDTVYGGADNDNIIGDNGGNDLFYGDDGQDTIAGGAGNDVLYGGLGNDSMDGGNDNDTLYGGDGQDTIAGSGGNDVFRSDLGNDSLTGGDSDDRFNMLDGFGNDTIVGGENTETTGDVLDFTAVTGNNTLTYTGGESGTVVNAGGTATFSQIESILLGVGNDSINGTATGTAFKVDSGAGNDTITGTSGADTITSGAGNDIIYGGAGTNTVAAGTGNDSIYSGTDAETLQGEDGDDTFYITGVSAADTIFGGTAGQTTGDILDASVATPASTLNLTSGQTGTLVYPNTGLLGGTSQTVTFSDIDIFKLGSGNDTMSAASATSGTHVYAGAGNDSLTGSGFNDTIYGGDGNDKLFGNAGNDTLVGGMGSDSIVAGTGDDWVVDEDIGNTVGGGADTIDLGDGNDTFIGSGQNVGDTDLVYGGIGDDNIQVRQSFDTVYGGAGNDYISSVAEDPAYGDVYYGDAGNDTILGTNTNDQIYGGADSDALYGGDNNDTLSGGSERDTLDGGAGNDVLTGGTGGDLFIAQGADTITDFDATTGISGNGNLDNDFVDLTSFYNKPALAIWNAANPGQKYDNPLKWLQADQADGILQQAGNLRIQNGGATVAGSLLNVENTAVCFVAGTRIATPKGKRPIERLKRGDLVETADHGLQPIRWIGQMTVPAHGDLAPILIEAGALGNRRDLMVSPLHRMVIGGWQAELLFGEAEVLVPAKMLVNGGSIRAVPMTSVEYYHIMFDTHEIVEAEGALSESFHPGHEGFEAIGIKAQIQILALFPHLINEGFASYGPSARRTLRSHEAKLLNMSFTQQIDKRPNLRRAG